MGNSGNRMGSSTTAEQAAADVDLKEKICVVTGSNTGIGKETARVLAKRNATVIMACRSIERGNEAKKEIVESLKVSNANYNENMIKVMELDLSSLQSVKQFSINFNKEYNQLHYLINNAGVMGFQQWQPSKENYEMQFATNHLGTFYLTILLTNVLKQSKPSRVITVSSDLHQRAPNPFIDFIKGCSQASDGPSKETYNSWNNYNISKACNLLFSREYNRRFQTFGITSVSLHPGVIATDLSRNMSKFMAGAFKLASIFLKSIPQGAATTVRCVSLKDNEIHGGHYYKDCNDAEGQVAQQFRVNFDYNAANDEKVANDQAYLLWQLTEKLITQKGFTFDLNANIVEQKNNVENDATTTTGTTGNVGASNNNVNQVVEEEPR